MTTILADARLGLMASDSAVSDGSRVWSAKKVHRIAGALVGLAGTLAYFEPFLKWYRAGMVEAPTFLFESSSALVLTSKGLFLFDDNSEKLQRVEAGREAIGSGAQAAIAAHEALGWRDPRKAVAIACRHDANSRTPARLYKI